VTARWGAWGIERVDGRRGERRDRGARVDVTATGHPVDGRSTTMASLWEYEVSVSRPGRDVVGYDVEATDGSIGKIDEASNRAASSYLVVDTGFWIFGKKRLIPAGVITRVDDEEQKVFVSMTKDQIKSAPDFEERDRDDRERYETYYGSLRR
jgi:hypothetical protein